MTTVVSGIIGANSVVGSDVEPYVIVAGNPAKELHKHFDDELINILLRFKWWNKSIEEINSLIPILTCSDLAKVELEKRIELDYDDTIEDSHNPCLRFQRKKSLSCCLAFSLQQMKCLP